MKSLEPVNKKFKELVKRDRARILTNYSKVFADFLFQITFLGVERVDDEFEYNDTKYFFTVSFDEDFVVFYHNEWGFEYSEGPTEAEFITEFSEDECDYFEGILEKLKLIEYGGAVLKEKKENEAEKLTKENVGSLLEKITFEQGLYILKFDNGKTLKTKNLF